MLGIKNIAADHAEIGRRARSSGFSTTRAELEELRSSQGLPSITPYDCESRGSISLHADHRRMDSSGLKTATICARAGFGASIRSSARHHGERLVADECSCRAQAPRARDRAAPPGGTPEAVDVRGLDPLRTRSSRACLPRACNSASISYDLSK